MNSISTYMMRDHKACDEHFAQAEDAVAAGDWARVTSSFAAFVDALGRHFELEEQILFPAFEDRTGMMTCVPCLRICSAQRWWERSSNIPASPKRCC